MTNQVTHIYQRTISLQERSSLSVLAHMISPGASVLDLGCGSGALGAYLCAELNCSVDGVTISTQEAEIAKPHYRHIVTANLDELDVSQAFAGQQYSYIVCADVLEHLKHPERILDACQSLLAPQGQLLISIPNASYSGLQIELMSGEWRYRTEGLLDRTHLRFFTRISLLRFLQEQQWSPLSLDVIERPLDDSEFQHIAADELPPAVLRHLMAQPDALTYQFICVAQPAQQVDSASTIAPQLLAQAHNAQATFSSNLYWADQHRFTEAYKQTVRGDIGQPHQVLVFQLPDFDAEHPTLRWDPANRPGFLHLHHILLKDAGGHVHWAWHAERDMPSTVRSQIAWQPAPATAPGTTLLLLDGDDPWLHIPVPPETLKACMQTGATSLEIAVGWPMSADYTLLARQTENLKADLQRSDEEILRWRAEHQAASHAFSEQHNRAEQLQTICAQQSDKIHALHLQLQAIHQNKAYRVVHKIAAVKNKLILVADQVLQRSTPDIQSAPPLEPEKTPTEFAVDGEVLESAQVSTTGEQLAQIPILGAAASTAVASNSVDVIIPVYRGLADTQRSITSVLQQMPLLKTPMRLIVINDASPEPELCTWLRDMAAKEPRMILLENDSNLGFVGTCNKAMALSPSHDIVLLNSDTEVANNWLDKLYATAYRYTDIGSVTPLSNNATICSYPKFCVSNPMPEGLDTSALDTICAAVNAEQSVTIPTGVGFCMYIRRDCLNQVGFFDEAHFGKGYGEENDFCMRAHNAGWQHQLALDTFVLHTGGVSFGSSKTPREEAAYNILKELHPTYDALVQAHLKANPAQAARHRIDRARLQHSPLPKILMVMHNVGGGTQRHVQELARYLEPRAICLVLIPLPDHQVQLQWLSPLEGYAEIFDWSTQASELLALLQDLQVRHVHFHHLLGFDPQIMQLPKQLNATYDFTAHDYYTACPQITLTTREQTYCGEEGVKQCTQCLQERPAPTQERIEDWRLRHRLFLLQARNVLAPSADCARRIHHYFPGARVRHVPHFDIPDTQALPAPQGYAISARANLRIFVLGGVSASKGGNVLEAVALAAARQQVPLEFHLIGYPHRQMPCQPTASLTVHGPYQDEQLPLLLERLQPDVVWFPALWPETYSYTLSACLQAGLPVIAPNLGAFTERLSGRAWTWMRPWDTSPEAWIQTLQHIRTQHFVTGHPPPPAPTDAQPAYNPQDAAWSYANDYLLASAPTAVHA